MAAGAMALNRLEGLTLAEPPAAHTPSQEEVAGLAATLPAWHPLVHHSCGVLQLLSAVVVQVQSYEGEFNQDRVFSG